MKLYQKRSGIFSYYSSEILVEAVIKNYSAIEYASALESNISWLENNIAMLRYLKENTQTLSSNASEALGDEKFDNKRYLEVVEEQFCFETENHDDNHLNDLDYINIANLKYPNEYDSCVIIKSNLVLKYLERDGVGRDFSYWTEFYRYSYKVIVRKNTKLDLTKDYSIDEIISLVDSKAILIVSCYSSRTDSTKDFKMAVTSCEKINKLLPKEWLESVKDSSNPFHLEYMAYLKQFVSLELIDESISYYSNLCQKILAYPEDKFIRAVLDYSNYKDAEIFTGMNKQQKIKLVKQYEKSHDLIKKAKEIIIKYSDAYQKCFT